MKDDQVLELLARTDAYAQKTPMPRGAWSHDTAISEIERRIEMDTRAKQHEAPSRRDWRGPLIAAAAFAALIIVVGVVVLVVTAGGDVEPAAPDAPATTQPPPATTPSTTAPAATTPAEQLVVDTFFAALNLGDTEALLGLFSDDAVIGFGGPPGETGVDDIHPDEFDAYFTWTVRSLPTVYAADQCDVIGTRVSCRVDYSNHLVNGALGEDGQAFHIFDVEAGSITQYYMTFSGRESSLVFDPFVKWVEANHPEAVDVVWRVDCCYVFPAFTDESARRYSELVDEYVASLEN